MASGPRGQVRALHREHTEWSRRFDELSRGAGVAQVQDMIGEQARGRDLSGEVVNFIWRQCCFRKSASVFFSPRSTYLPASFRNTTVHTLNVGGNDMPTQANINKSGAINRLLQARPPSPSPPPPLLTLPLPLR